MVVGSVRIVRKPVMIVGSGAAALDKPQILRNIGANTG
jgi:hypothetical protein